MNAEINRAAGIFSSRWRIEGQREPNENQVNHLEALIKVLNEVHSGCLLEIGMGTGYTTNTIATIKPDCQVIGMDITPESIELARQPSIPATYVLGNAFSLPFANESVAASWHEGLIEHYPLNWREIIKEQHRITRKGGLIITSVPNVLNIPYTFVVKLQGKEFRSYPADGFLPGKWGALQRLYRDLNLQMVNRYGWGITYPARQMYRWDETTRTKRYPLYSRVFHFLGNISDRSLQMLDQAIKGKLSKYIGFEFMLVGRKV